MSAILPVYRRSDITIARGEGAYLFSPEGVRYLDFAAGIAVNSLGHCHPHLLAALDTQAKLLWHCSNMYKTQPLADLASRLTEACFADKVFFCNSGSEAVECGLKMLRKYQDANGQPQRFRVITMQGGFHGRSLACISAGGNAVARDGYGPLLEGFDQVPLNDLAAAKAAITDDTAAILVEPIQGEGGIREATPEFLQGLRALCDVHGLLLFLDEVQCGMGRTGALFAHQQMGVIPDIVSTAKGIGGGFPLAACLASDKVAACMTPGTHGSTYGANPLAMAVGNAVLDIMLAEGFFAQVETIGDTLKTGLVRLADAYPGLIAQARGRGLMLGLKMQVDNRAFVEKLREKHLLTSPAEENVVRITPPLIIDIQHVTEALAIMESVCKEWV